MRFLIFFQHALLRHFESSLLEVAERGHEVVLVTPHADIDSKIPGSLVDHPSVSVLQWKSRGGPLEPTLAVTRHARDYLRYLDPRLKDAWANRERAWNRLVSTVLQGTRPQQEIGPPPWLELSQRELEVLDTAFDDIESLVPPDPTLCDLITQPQADAVLITPLVSFGSNQADVVRACQAMGVPCGLLVFSWDNLSNKGVMHVRPDRVFVWNEVQAQEAVELHKVPRENVVITGAPRFDDFFELDPSRPREAYLERRGLDPSRPLILYLCSSPFVAENEPRFVDVWLDAVRASKHDVVRKANVLIRSHPRARGAWQAWSPEGRENVALNNRTFILGGQRLYDDLAHCDAVVGLNTSAEIEAAIVGKPVYTLEAGNFAPGQGGSTHFSYMLRENGGCVEHATSIEQHLDQLAEGLGGGYDRQAIAEFVRSFVRPHGIDKRVTPILAKAMIELAVSKPDASGRDSSSPLTDGTLSSPPSGGAADANPIGPGESLTRRSASG